MRSRTACLERADRCEALGKRCQQPFNAQLMAETAAQWRMLAGRDRPDAVPATLEVGQSLPLAHEKRFQALDREEAIRLSKAWWSVQHGLVQTLSLIVPESDASGRPASWTVVIQYDHADQHQEAKALRQPA